MNGDTLNSRFDTAGPVVLRLRVAAGEVEVEADAEGHTEIEITPANRAAEEVLDRVRVESRETSVGTRIDVETPEREGPGGLGRALLGRGTPEFEVRVRCPEGTAVELESRSADLEARGRLGAVDVKTASGDASVEEVLGNAEFASASGDIALGRVAGSATVTTASGDVELGAVGGMLRANLVSGDLEVREAAGSIDAKTVSGDQNLACVSRGTVTVRSVSGDVSVGVRRGAAVWLDVRTLSGDTHSELSPEDGPPAEGPNLEIRINTVSGDVHIARAAAAADRSLGAPHAPRTRGEPAVQAAVGRPVDLAARRPGHRRRAAARRRARARRVPGRDGRAHRRRLAAAPAVLDPRVGLGRSRSQPAPDDGGRGSRPGGGPAQPFRSPTGSTCSRLDNSSRWHSASAHSRCSSPWVTASISFASLRRKDLIEAQAAMSASRSAAYMGGPPLAGVLVQVAGAPVALVLDALSFLASALFVRRIDVDDRLQGEQNESVRRRLVGGRPLSLRPPGSARLPRLRDHHQLLQLRVRRPGRPLHGS